MPGTHMHFGVRLGRVAQSRYWDRGELAEIAAMALSKTPKWTQETIQDPSFSHCIAGNELDPTARIRCCLETLRVGTVH